MPSWVASRFHSARPMTIPTGTATTTATIASALACQATARRTCPRTNPSVFKIARSRRRRRIAVTTACASVAADNKPSSPASTNGNAFTRPKSRMSFGVGVA